MKSIFGHGFVKTSRGFQSLSSLTKNKHVLVNDFLNKKTIITNDAKITKENMVTVETDFNSFSCTPDRDVCVFEKANTSNGYTLKYKPVSDLSLNDYLVFSTKPSSGHKIDVPGDYKRSEKCIDVSLTYNTDFAWFIGHLHGDGNVSTNKRRVSFASSKHDTQIIEKIEYTFLTLSDQLNIKKTKVKDSYYNIYCYSANISKFLYQFKQPHTPIQIPEFIWKSSIGIRSAYLAGLLDSDGSVNHGCELLATKYVSFSKQVQTLYASLGIPTSVVCQPTSVDRQHYKVIARGTTIIDLIKNRIGKYSIKQPIVPQQRDIKIFDPLNNKKQINWSLVKKGNIFDNIVPIKVKQLSENKKIGMVIESDHVPSVNGYWFI